MNAANPYFHRGPIKQARYFYNRGRETTRALQMVKNGQNVSVVGPRRIGKTSFLFHLSDVDVRGENGLALEQSLFVYVDGEALAGCSKAQVLRFMLQETVEQKGRHKIDLAPVSDRRSFEQAVRKLIGPGQQLVYLIDEFECLGKNPNLDADFFSFLRSLNARYNIAYVTASLIPLLALIDDRGQLSSRFFNVFMPIQLGLFNAADARELIRQPARVAGREFSQEIENLILELAGPHPFFLQIVCYHAFELSRDDPKWGAHTRRQLEKEVQADLRSHFEYFVSRLTGEERRVLARLLDGEPLKASTAALEALERQCLVRQQDSGYALVSRAFADFVRRSIGTTLAATTAEGERRMSTALFVDVAGFTPLTEQSRPEEILAIIKAAQRLFVDIVDRHGGKVANFGGDSVMALFPTEQPDGATRAVRAALEIQSSVALYAHELERKGGGSLAVRAGLDTGIVILGEIGGEQRAEYTALGDAVNLAQRMETLADPGQIVISERTYKQVRGQFKVKSLGLVRVKGKKLPQKAYRVVGEKGERR